MLLDVVYRLSHVEVDASHDDVDTVAAVDHAGIAHAEWSGRAHVGHGICRPARHGAHGGIVGRAGVHGRSELLGEMLVEIAKLGAVEQGHGDGIRVVFVLGIAPEPELDAGLERCEDVLAVFVGDTDHLGVETRDLRDASVIARLADFPLPLEELVDVMGHIRLLRAAGLQSKSILYFFVMSLGVLRPRNSLTSGSKTTSQIVVQSTSSWRSCGPKKMPETRAVPSLASKAK